MTNGICLICWKFLPWYYDDQKMTKMTMMMMTHTRMPTTVVMSTMYPSRVRFAPSSSVAKTWKKVSAEMKIIQEQVLISSSRTFFKRKLNLSKYFEHFLWTCPCWNAKDEGDCVESHHFWPPNLLSILAVSTYNKGSLREWSFTHPVELLSQC